MCYNAGVEVLVEKLRDLDNLVGRRIAAEALQNVASGDEYLRAKVAAEIKEELKRTWRNEIDPIVNMHLKEFLRNAGDKEAFVYS